MVEAGVGGKIIECSGGACFGVGGSVDETAYAGCVEGSGTHRAGLQGGVEGAAGEAPAVESFGGAAEGQEFGVSGRIVCGLAFVVGEGYNFGTPRHDGAYRDLPLLGSGACFL